jgi:hypothetical protein
MKLLLAIFGTVFLITFLAAPTMGAGWFWDGGNGLGFAAFSGLLYLTITSFRRIDVQAHRILSFAVLFIAVAHALWFLLGDAAAVEYIKIGAPDYMWLGIVGLVCLFMLVIISLQPDRQKLHKTYPLFLYWHRVLAVLTIAFCAYHIVVSNFYLTSWYQAALFVSVAIATSFGRTWWIRLESFPSVTLTTFLVVTLVFTGLFSAVRNFQF